MAQVVKSQNPSESWKGCCISIGNFDGVHLGHAELVNSLKEMSARHGTVGVVMTFYPHPAVVIRGKVPKRLLPIDDRVRMLLALGAGAVWVVPFHSGLARVSAGEFIEEILLKKLKISGIVVGPDFRFGANREGDSRLLAQYGERHRFDLKIVSPFLVDGLRVSSSELRRLLLEGKVEPAGALLGRNYRVKGTVVHGMKMGSRIGFPTANIRLSDDVLTPANGIYVIRLRIGGTPSESRPYDGVANIGTRPTLESDGAVSVEAHLFGIDRPLYGEAVTMEFLKRIRDETRFDSLEQLVAAIELDVRTAREYFAGLM